MNIVILDLLTKGMPGHRCSCSGRELNSVSLVLLTKGMPGHRCVCTGAAQYKQALETFNLPYMIFLIN
jgi:hypothetical protein